MKSTRFFSPAVVTFLALSLLIFAYCYSVSTADAGHFLRNRGCSSGSCAVAAPAPQQVVVSSPAPSVSYGSQGGQFYTTSFNSQGSQGGYVSSGSQGGTVPSVSYGQGSSFGRAPLFQRRQARVASRRARWGNCR